MGYPVTLIRGDGIGPEVTEAVRIAIDATGVAVDWNIVDTGREATEADSIASQVLGAMRETKVAIAGPFAAAANQRSQPAMAKIRKQLQLYAHLQPAKSMVGSNFSDINLLLVYESANVSAGFGFDRTTNEAADVRDYLARMSGIPIYEDAALDIRLVSVLGCRRLMECAFEQARTHDRHKVTAVHRSDTQPFTDGLFLEIAREIAKDYLKIEFEDCLADTLCTQLIQTPQNYDVLVMPHLYGQMISDLCTGMNGGASVTPRATLGDEYAIFDAVHGPVPQLAGQNKVNPTALILSGVMLLRHLGEYAAAQQLQAAVETVIAQQKAVTDDLVPEGTQPVGTREMADAIASAI
ncbi:Homoisocitrate dehydrogenase [Acaryochloris thomasi RCC1774]|uniref:Homoisocitrate dehydrogenase n=1 Tax=Acaryochloris thomasi RCC1774 TaxID=1764569 RepID=A0A2W1K318_9CYAN|nr:isocitrate/isopropylmalate family dehydrogenase [Acaryochloris thomasi]PZD74621.1 Homoisocitrate dehydrogenase [Acaryochloris thomasi RCC1774]